MSTKTYITHCFIALALCTLTLIFNVYADANASYLLDKNQHIPSSVGKYISLSMLDFLFFIPLIIIASIKTNKAASIAWLLLTALMVFFAYSFIGEGGDQHGCESCAGIFIIYIFIFPVLAALTFIIILFRKLWLRRKA